MKDWPRDQESCVGLFARACVMCFSRARSCRIKTELKYFQKSSWAVMVSPHAQISVSIPSFWGDQFSVVALKNSAQLTASPFPWFDPNCRKLPEVFAFLIDCSEQVPTGLLNFTNCLILGWLHLIMWKPVTGLQAGSAVFPKQRFLGKVLRKELSWSSRWPKWLFTGRCSDKVLTGNGSPRQLIPQGRQLPEKRSGLRIWISWGFGSGSLCWSDAVQLNKSCPCPAQRV